MSSPATVAPMFCRHSRGLWPEHTLSVGDGLGNGARMAGANLEHWGISEKWVGAKKMGENLWVWTQFG